MHIYYTHLHSQFRYIVFVCVPVLVVNLSQPRRKVEVIKRDLSPLPPQIVAKLRE